MPTTPSSPSARFLRMAGLVAAAVLLPGLAAASFPEAMPRANLASLPSLAITVVPRTTACPETMAHVGTSCVDKYEASLVEMHEDGTESAFSPYQAPNAHNVRAVSVPGVVPQAHVSMVEAKRACSASGKRLCKAAEWKSACKGPDSTRYPYGDKRLPGACVDTNRTSPMHVLHHGEHSSLSMNDERANQQQGTVEKTGATESCVNGYGVHDIVGNVHEWTDDGSFRGGYYLDTKLNGEGCEYRTTAHAPSYYDYSTGFRCCADEGFAADDES